jgi:fibro-slime domain-containing protein
LFGPLHRASFLDAFDRSRYPFLVINRAVLFLGLCVVAGCSKQIAGTASPTDASTNTRDATSDAAPNDAAAPLPDLGPPRDAQAPNCGSLNAVVRDFRDSFPDMEREGAFLGGELGIVETTLGMEGKPVYAHSGATLTVSGPSSFMLWYRDVAAFNRAFTVALPLTETESGSGVFVYDNAAFFPVDDRGFGNEGRDHNFHFTTEIAATFVYKGGEEFTFRGDDDVFVFVNRRLALDLGGVHPAVEGTIDFDDMADELGITLGNTYELHVFHAERHTVESNFRIETSIDCFVLL